MVTRQGTSQLLRELRELYFRICDNELFRRLGLYRRYTDTNKILDISTPLEDHLDELAQTSNTNTADTSNNSPKAASKDTRESGSTVRPRKRRYNVFQSVSVFFHTKKVFTPLKTNDLELGEKLKESTLSHIHTAQLNARQGNTVNAKLHAGIANDALKEAAHYMSNKDYEGLCDEVSAIFKKLERL